MLQINGFKFFTAVAFVLGATFLPRPLVAAPSDLVSLSQNYQRETLPSVFSALIWNVHKASDDQMINDLSSLAQSTELALLQELVDRSDVVRGVRMAHPGFGWSMAKAFYSDRESSNTGVATGSSAKPLMEEVLLSHITEPVSNTPKSAMLSKFRIEGVRDELLVVNIHAINFVLLHAFQAHCDQIIQKIASHQGPMIVAGDLNTWSQGRLEYLTEALGRLGLVRAPIQMTGFFTLDHVFVRQIQVLSAQQVRTVDSSDHFPLLVTFAISQLP